MPKSTNKTDKTVSDDPWVASHPIVGPTGEQVFVGDPIPADWDETNKSALVDAGSIVRRSELGDHTPNTPGSVAPMQTTDSARVNNP